MKRKWAGIDKLRAWLLRRDSAAGVETAVFVAGLRDDRLCPARACFSLREDKRYEYGEGGRDWRPRGDNSAFGRVTSRSVHYTCGTRYTGSNYRQGGCPRRYLPPEAGA